MRWDSCLLVQFIAVNVRLLLTMFIKGPGNIFLFADLCYM